MYINWDKYFHPYLHLKREVYIWKKVYTCILLNSSFYHQIFIALDILISNVPPEIKDSGNHVDPYDNMHADHILLYIHNIYIYKQVYTYIYIIFLNFLQL
jgi:hypothetical protein